MGGGAAELQELVATADPQGTLAAAVGRFVEDVAAAADYEALVAQSDAVKTELAAVAVPT